MARPMTAYIDHGWKPQWKKVYSIARCAASSLPGAAMSIGGVLRWVRGSATP